MSIWRLGRYQQLGTETTEVTGQDAEGNDIVTDVVTQIQTDTGTAASANQHPNGTSSICYSDACINVAVSPRGASQIMDVFNPLGMAWGQMQMHFHKWLRIISMMLMLVLNF